MSARVPHTPTSHFDPAKLYLSDEGEVKCGAHVGTEATYNPSRWSLLGDGPTIEIEDERLECEGSCAIGRGRAK